MVFQREAHILCAPAREAIPRERGQVLRIAKVDGAIFHGDEHGAGVLDDRFVISLHAIQPESGAD